jgi:hypothetical protein
MGDVDKVVLVMTPEILYNFNSQEVEREAEVILGPYLLAGAITGCVDR